MAGEKYDGGADSDDFKKGVYNSQLSDDPPWKYIGTYQITEDPHGDVNSDGQSCVIFESSVSERTSCCVVETSRSTINFETGEESKDPQSIRW